MDHRDAANRGLLFGLLALQNGLVDHDQLVAAFRSWTRDKARPLAEHLVALGGLDADQRGVVDALVNLHLKRDGGDTEKSLAAVSAGRSTREGLAGLGDPDLEATLAHVGSGSGSDAAADRTFSYSAGAASTGGQRYRILRPHARGGLGAVFVAIDGELNREVALKQILDHHADDAVSRQRFLMEAEITGGLEHPGIVPVYGLGAYGDGRPYYAMRFIKGDSLKQEIARFHADESLGSDPGRRSLELRQLLRRFLDVCNAVDYAHSRGVLHRDIKPGNIIVGKHGETLVVDWGLAKSVHRPEPGAADGERTLRPSKASGSAETLPGTALGTPGYMSPEQASGDVERLGPRSDVYSLGATLYCLLTGRAPFRGDDVGAVLSAVRKGEFPPPGRVRRGVPAGLERVCLKAMALDPAGRYAGPRALADDVEHWLADEPVSADPEGPARRLARWGRRHRAWVRAGAAALVAVTAVAVAALVVVDKARRRERAARAGESAARAEADANFAAASDAVEQVVNVADSTLASVPGREPERRRLAEAALATYRGLLAKRPANPKVRLEAARVYRLVGNVTRGTGRFEPARLLYGEAIRLLTGLRDETPRTRLYRDRLAETSLDAADNMRMAGRPADAEEHLREAVAAADGLLVERPDDPNARRTRARSLYTLAEVQADDGRAGDAVGSFDAAVRLFTPLADAPGSSRLERIELAMILYERGDALREAGKVADAERSIRESIARAGRLLVEAPADNNVRFVRAAADLSLGRALATSGRPDEALAAFGGAVDGLARLAQEFPTLTDYRRTLAVALDERCASHIEAGRLDAAEADAVRARRLMEAVTAESPAAPDYQGALGRILGRLGRIALDRGRPDEARTLLADAVARQAKALDANPGSPIGRAAQRRHRDDLARAAGPTAPPSPGKPGG